MKTFARLSLLALAVAALAFGLTHWLAPHPQTPADEITWLTSEFHLTTAQTAAIEKLHAAYDPVCMEHCRLIRETRTRLISLKTSTPRDAAAYAAAEAEMTHLKGICHDATQKHLEAVAAQMSPAEGRRFLVLTLPKLSAQSHDAPLDPR